MLQIKQFKFGKIYRSVILLTIVILFLKIFGFFRTIVIANYFGSDSGTDAIFIALSIILMFNLISLKSFSEGIIPYLKSNFSREYFKNKFIKILSISILINILLYFFGKQILPIFAMGFNQESIALTNEALKIISFSIVPLMLSSLLMAYFNFQKSYNYAHIGDFVRNLILIISIILWHKNVMIISYGWLVGSWLGFITLQLLFFVKIYKKLSRDSVYNYKIFTSGIIYTIIINFFIYATVVLDKTMLSFITSGNITNFTYSDSIRSLILATFVVAISRIFLVEFSDNTIKGNRHLINIFLIILVSSIGLYFFSNLIVNIIFNRGKITIEDINIITLNLKILSISLPFYSMFQILSQKLYSRKKYLSLFIIITAGIIIKVVILFFTFEEYKLYSVLASKVAFEIIVSIFIGLYFYQIRKIKVKL